MVFRCPVCKSSNFHVEDLGGDEYKVCCWKTKECTWSMNVKKH